MTTTTEKPAGMLTLEQARTFLRWMLGTAPDTEVLLDLMQKGHIVGIQRGEETYITEQSLQSIVAQLQKIEGKRETRLALHAVDIWRRDGNQRAVAITLAIKNTVLTAEQVCEDQEAMMTEASVRATLAAIKDAIGNKLELNLVKVKQYTLPNVDGPLITVLVVAGEGNDARKLLGVAMTGSTSPIEAAARATLNALNRTIAPYLNDPDTWKEALKKLLP